jgi:hypothetical protein
VALSQIEVVKQKLKRDKGEENSGSEMEKL